MTSRKEAERLRGQLDRAFTGEAWHGTPVLDVLAGITVGQAAARPAGQTHSIAEIVNHIDAWLAIARKRSGGAAVGAISDEMDWPPPTDSTEASWRASRERLRTSYRELASMISGLSDADLDRTVQGEIRTYTVYEDLHGVVQHSIYHLGQIVILAKAAAAGA